MDNYRPTLERIRSHYLHIAGHDPDAGRRFGEALALLESGNDDAALTMMMSNPNEHFPKMAKELVDRYGPNVTLEQVEAAFRGED